jgi:transcription antitermination protein NusB
VKPAAWPAAKGSSATGWAFDGQDAAARAVAKARAGGYTHPPMSRAHKIREIVLQVLFAWDATGEVDEPAALQMAMDAEPVDAAVRVAALEQAHAAWEYRKQADAWIQRLAPNRPLWQQPGVDLNVLRLAMWELTSRDTPPKVVLNEAIELAKQYSTENSPGFVNAVLDSVLKELGGLKSE